MTNQTTAVGLDLGNTWTEVCVSWPGCEEGLVAKIPSRYARKCPPGQPNKSGQLGKAQAFSLLFSKEGGNVRLWFGQDTLAIRAMQKFDELKYDAAHIQILFKAVLYQWQQTHKGRHKVDLGSLDKLNIVSSMPPGLFEDAKTYAKATKAYKDAFNKDHSHLQIRDGKRNIQIVTHFSGLQQEAVAWGSNKPRRGECILTFDIGGGTIDYALFNGSHTPRKTKTENTGLLHVYKEINPVDPGLAELEVLRNKASQPDELLVYYNEIERDIQTFIRRLPVKISRIYIIGGGASLMPVSVQKNIKLLAPQVIIEDEYANARANWRAAGGK